MPFPASLIALPLSSLQYNIAHFSCPFEFELEYNNPTLSPGGYSDLLHFNITIHYSEYIDQLNVVLCTDCLPKWPRVLLEVSSLDYWDRHRIEGYGFVDLPCRPGLVYYIT